MPERFNRKMLAWALRMTAILDLVHGQNRQVETEGEEHKENTPGCVELSGLKKIM